MSLSNVTVSRIKFAFLMIFMSGFSLAFGQEAPWQTGMQDLIDLLSGTTATLFATAAVMFLGYMMLAGQMNFKLAASIIAGIVVIFGAAHIVSWFAG